MTKNAKHELRNPASSKRRSDVKDIPAYHSISRRERALAKKFLAQDIANWPVNAMQKRMQSSEG